MQNCTARHMSQAAELQAQLTEYEALQAGRYRAELDSWQLYLSADPCSYRGKSYPKRVAKRLG